MKFQKIMVFGNDVLRAVAKPVDAFNQELEEIVEAMYVAMYRGEGIGLAAPQVGLSRRIIVIDIQSYQGPKIALINPVIISRSRKVEVSDEGCLSVPGLRGDVERSVRIEVEARKPDGELIRFTARDLFARVIQHEMDHLDGVLFVDRLQEQQRANLEGELKLLAKRQSVPIA